MQKALENAPGHNYHRLLQALDLAPDFPFGLLSANTFGQALSFVFFAYLSHFWDLFPSNRPTCSISPETHFARFAMNVHMPSHVICKYHITGLNYRQVYVVTEQSTPEPFCPRWRRR